MLEKMANITKGKPCVSSTPGQLLKRGLLSLWSVSFPEPLKTVIVQKQIKKGKYLQFSKRVVKF